MSDAESGPEATNTGAASGDGSAADTAPQAQPPLDLRQLLLLAASSQFAPPPNHPPGWGYGAPFSGHGAAFGQGAAFSAGPLGIPPGASHGVLGGGFGGYGSVSGGGGGGLGSPLTTPGGQPGSRNVTFVAPAGGAAPSGNALLQQMLARLAALERAAASDASGARAPRVPSRRESAPGEDSVERSDSPTPSEFSQASTEADVGLDSALGVADPDLQHAADRHLSKQWARSLHAAKLTLDQKSTAAVLNALLCIGRSHRFLSFALDSLVATAGAHTDRRYADEALGVAVEAERELASILAHFSVLCSKTMAPHAIIIREAARLARQSEKGDRASIDGLYVADRHVADIVSNAFKKLSEQAIKDMCTKDKSSKKSSSSNSDEEAVAELRKELEVAKKQLQQANNKLAGASRRKTEVPGAQVHKRVDDKAKASKDKDKAPSTEGAGP
jgi:hypothetical protein